MPQEMSRRDEQRGTRWIFVGAAAIALAAGFGLLAWFFVPGFSRPGTPKNAGILSDQTVGMSTASEQEPLRIESPNSTGSYTVERNERLSGSEKPNLTPLRQAQVKAIQQYAATNAQEALPNVGFSIVIGGAVPAGLKLNRFPPQLAQALPTYAENQYFIVDHQFVVVEKQTRRIVAIVPTPNAKESSR